MTPEEREFVEKFFQLRPLTGKQAEKGLKEFIQQVSRATEGGSPHIPTQRLAHKLLQTMSVKNGPLTGNPDPNWFTRNKAPAMRAIAVKAQSEGELGNVDLIPAQAKPPASGQPQTAGGAAQQGQKTAPP